MQKFLSLPKISHYGTNTSYFRIINRFIFGGIGRIGGSEKKNRLRMDVLLFSAFHAARRTDYRTFVG